MMTLAPERSWLLDRGMLKLVHQCRRLILAEFGVKLHLTDNDLEERLATYARQSRSSHLTRTWEELVEHVPELADDNADGAAEVQRYRGQALAEQSSAPANRSDGEGKTRTITYRGQKMVVPAH